MNQHATATFQAALDKEANGDVDGACHGYRQVMESGHPELAPAAASALAVLLLGAGELDGAEQACRRAATSALPMVAARAGVTLGMIHRQRGDLDAARQAWEEAAATGDPEHGPMALFNLGCLALESDEFHQGVALLRQVVTAGHERAAQQARLLLLTLPQLPY